MNSDPVTSDLSPPTHVPNISPGVRSRVIARLDVKGQNLIKGVQMEGLRIVGDPLERAREYYRQGIDELVYLDIVASLYGRNSLLELVSRTAASIFVPITVGGGIRSVEDARAALRAGADKIAINTAAIQNPKLITEIATQFGAQCVVVCIEAKIVGTNTWEAYYNSGREKSGLHAVEWAKKAVELGAGEIFLTSVDRDGTRRGFDLELVKAISSSISVPVVCSGGFAQPSDAAAALLNSGASAVAIADALHFNRSTVAEIKNYLSKASVLVRMNE
jgi:cyclase